MWIAGMVLAVIGFIAVVCFQLWNAYERDKTHAVRDNQNLARLLEEHLATKFAKLDATLRLAAERYGTALAANEVDRPSINAELAFMLDNLPESAALRIFDSSGQATFDASGQAPNINIADRDYFQAHVHSHRSELVISDPVFARALKTWIVTLSRRLQAPDGRFLGIVLAVIRVQELERIFQTINIGQRGMVGLYTTNLKLVTRHPMGSAQVGERLQGSTLEKLLADGLQQGDFFAVSPVDQVGRLFTFRESMNLPYVVIVGRSEQEVFGAWQTNAWVALFVSLFSVASMGMVVYVWRRSYGRAVEVGHEMAANWRTASMQTRALLDSLPDAAWMKDKEGHFVDFNAAYCRMVRKSREDLMGKTVFAAWPEPVAKQFADAHLQVLHASAQLRREQCLTLPGGEEIYVEIIRTPMRDEHGDVVGVVGVARDLTERHSAEARIRHMAEHDALTNLPNRNLLHDRLSNSIAHAVQSGGEVHIAVLFLDLDRFKNVNDSLGHDAGDQLLQEVALRLTNTLYATDTVSRLGGDEFAVLLGSYWTQTSVGRVAQRVLDAFAKPFNLSGHEVTVTGSIGIAVYPQDGADIGALLKNADTAMYHAKSAGRNQYQFFSEEMNARVFERLSLETYLRKALDQHEFVLHYQPQVSTDGQSIHGVEALVRWTHPELGMVSPGKFIPIAEDTNLIVPLGRWILGEACRQNKAWQEQGLPPVVVSVNLSPVQFRQPNLIAEIQQVLHDAGLDPRWLELEITEGSLMADTDQMIERLKQIKGLGVAIALDDFGTGYSSLNYLRRFPLDRIKIDQSFVRDVHLQPDNAAIIHAIIGIARSLQLEVIAEGVEVDDERRFLSEANCPMFQGYYFSRPEPASNIAALLAKPGMRH